MTKGWKIFYIVLIAISAILVAASIFGFVFFLSNYDKLLETGTFLGKYNLVFMGVVFVLSGVSLYMLISTLVKACKE